MWSLAKSVCGSNFDFSAFGYFSAYFSAFFLLIWQYCQLVVSESIEEEQTCFIFKQNIFL